MIPRAHTAGPIKKKTKPLLYCNTLSTSRPFSSMIGPRTFTESIQVHNPCPNHKDIALKLVNEQTNKLDHCFSYMYFCSCSPDGTICETGWSYTFLLLFGHATLCAAAGIILNCYSRKKVIYWNLFVLIRWFETLSTLGKISADDRLAVFFLFSQKTG